MAWSKNISTNQKSFGKAILSLFVGMAFISCAGTDSSAQNNGEDNPNLFKAGTPIADTLVSRMPEFARSVFKGTLDSFPGEYYYYATNGRIDSLLQKEGKQYKAIVSITYDSPNAQNSFELKKGNYNYKVNDGVLIAEKSFPKYFKGYWNNGKPQNILIGNLYSDGQGFIKVDSGHSEVYFENGNIKEKNDWENKQSIASKQWNENGLLVKEIDFPYNFKEYWNNGNAKQILTGLLFRNDQGIIKVDSGHGDIYFENGKIQEQNDWKNKQPVAHKKWNKNGVLINDVKFSEYSKEYWDNGNQKSVLTGFIYLDHQSIVKMDNGHSDIYFENGKIKQQADWDNKQVIVLKEWDKNGTLIKDIKASQYAKEYWNNGNPKAIATGILYRNDQGNFSLDSGHSELYFENGKIKEQNDWRNKQPIASKQWNEDGVLIEELDFPKVKKTYWKNGKLKEVLTGRLYRNDQACFVLDSGHAELYFENGKVKEKSDWKNKQPVASKIWNEKGVLTKEYIFPKYTKEYFDNGNIKQIVAGLLYRDQDTIKVDSGRSKTYFENGKMNQQNDWKNKQGIASKQWNEKGVLIKEFVFPNYIKEYWNNGKIKREWTGQIYWSSPTSLDVENGSLKEYYENGKLKNHTNYKDKKPYSSREWNEKGTLTIEWDLSAGYLKHYNENGSIHIVMNGYSGKKGSQEENGDLTVYHNNGKPQFQEQYKEYKTISKKIWYENGNLMAEGDISKGIHKEFFENGKISRDVSGKFHYEDKDIILESGSDKRWYENGNLKSEVVFPNREKIYYQNGALGFESEGTLYYDDQKKIQVQDGFIKRYFENGKIKTLENFKDKKQTSKKVWYENGTQLAEIVFPKYEKYYYDNGALLGELEGTLYYDEQGKIKVQDGIKKSYHENGKMGLLQNFKDKKTISKKTWYKNGNIFISTELPKYYKEFYDNGKIKLEATGTIVEKNEIFSIKDGTYNMYDHDGKITYSATYKDFQIVSEKK